MKARSAAYSVTGTGRMINQDAYCALDTMGFWAVSDGMGGASRGEVASALLIQALQQVPLCVVEEAALGDPARRCDAVIQSCVQDIHGHLRDEITRASTGEKIGTTLVACWLCEQTAHVWWIGDSRVYGYHGDHIRLLTRDHSRAQQLVRKGLLTPEAAKTHPGRHYLVQAIGMGEGVYCEKRTIPVQKGDRLLLCTDGLYPYIALRDLYRILKDMPLDQAAQAVVKHAQANKSSDDITALVVEIGICA